jgi:hypothetical protein
MRRSEGKNSGGAKLAFRVFKSARARMTISRLGDSESTAQLYALSGGLGVVEGMIGTYQIWLCVK